jgi:hypothetical protein
MKVLFYIGINVRGLVKNDKFVDFVFVPKIILVDFIFSTYKRSTGSDNEKCKSLKSIAWTSDLHNFGLLKYTFTTKQNTCKQKNLKLMLY